MSGVMMSYTIAKERKTSVMKKELGSLPLQKNLT